MALWTPAEIDTALWLKANDEATLVRNASEEVTEWQDKSGNNRHATASAAAPTDTTMLAKQAMAFNGWLRFLVPHDPALSASGGLTVFGVVKFNATTDNRGWTGKWATGGLDWVMSRSTLGVFSWTVRQSDSAMIDSSFPPDLVPHIWAGRVIPGGLLESWQDGVAGPQQAFLTPNGSASISLAIGSYSTGGGVDFVGAVGEAIYLDGPADQDTIDNIIGYLAHEWELDGNLPADHPFKANPPTLFSVPMALYGTVRDKNGALAEGRGVHIIRELDHECIAYATTNASGEYEIELAPAASQYVGNVTAGSASSITDNTKNWTVDEFANHHGVRVTSGTQAGQWRQIVSNTSDTLTLASDLPGPTAPGDQFAIAPLHTLIFSGEANRNALVYSNVMPAEPPPA